MLAVITGCCTTLPTLYAAAVDAPTSSAAIQLLQLLPQMQHGLQQLLTLVAVVCGAWGGMWARTAEVAAGAQGLPATALTVLANAVASCDAMDDHLQRCALPLLSPCCYK